MIGNCSSDASRSDEQYEKITRELRGQLSLLSSQGDEHDRIALALEIEKKQIALGTGATDLQKQGVADLVTKIDEATKAQKKLNEEAKAFNEAYGSVSNSLSGAIKEISHGGSGLDALNKSLSSIQDSLIDATLTGSGPFGKALGFAGKDGAVGGAFGALGDIFGLNSKSVAEMNVTAGNVVVMGGGAGLSGVGGGAGGFLGGIFDKIGSFLGSIGQNAGGTDSWRGGMTWVGERGPELLNLPRGSQIMSNERSMAFARDQASAARAHAAAIAMNGNRGSAPAVAASPVTVNLIGAPQGTQVKESSDGKGGRRIDVVIAERVAAGMAAPQGRDVLAGMGVRQRLARM